MTSFSVVIPCYKYGHFLEDAVTSVLDDQDGVDVRVLIIDDASPDDSADVAREIAARDPRVEVAVHTTNRGNIATYNEGLLEWATNDYTVLMSADDQLTPGALLRARELLDAHPEVGFVYGHPLWFWQDQPIRKPRTRVRGWSVWPGQWWLERRLRQGENCITSPEVVVRTAVQKRVGGYDARLPHTADQEMWMRLAATADVGFLKGVDQAFYRVHTQNMRKNFNALMDLSQKRLAFDLVLDRYSARLSDPKRLSDGLHRRLGREALWSAVHAYDLGQADQAQVDELVAFAVDCWPGAGSSTAYRALQWRRRTGPPPPSHWTPLGLPAFARKTHGWLQRRSWKYRGF